MKSLIQALKQAWHKYRVMRCAYTMHSDWNDDLIWCPSQCYKHIEYKGKQFVIYLRWRHSDPWSAEIVECIPDGQFYMHSKGYEWHYLNVSDWADTELNQLKKEVEWYVKDWLVRHIA